MSPWMWTALTWLAYAIGAYLAILAVVFVRVWLGESYESLRKVPRGPLMQLIAEEVERRAREPHSDPRELNIVQLRLMHRAELLKALQWEYTNALSFPLLRRRTRDGLKCNLAEVCLELKDGVAAAKLLKPIMARRANDLPLHLSMLNALTLSQQWRPVLDVAQRILVNFSQLDFSTESLVRTRRVNALVMLERPMDGLDDARWLWSNASFEDIDRWRYLWILQAYDAEPLTSGYRSTAFTHFERVPHEQKPWWITGFVSESLRARAEFLDSFHRESALLLRGFSVHLGPEQKAHLALVAARRMCAESWSLSQFAYDFALCCLQAVPGLLPSQAPDDWPSCGLDMAEANACAQDIGKHLSITAAYCREQPEPALRGALFLAVVTWDLSDEVIRIPSPDPAGNQEFQAVTTPAFEDNGGDLSPERLARRFALLGATCVRQSGAVALGRRYWQLADVVCRYPVSEAEVFGFALEAVKTGLAAEPDHVLAAIGRARLAADRIVDWDARTKVLHWLAELAPILGCAGDSKMDDRVKSAGESFAKIARLGVPNLESDLNDAAEGRAVQDEERERAAYKRIINKTARVPEVQRRVACLTGVAREMLDLDHADLAEQAVLAARAQLDALGRTLVRARVHFDLIKLVPREFATIRRSLTEEGVEIAWHCYAGESGLTELERLSAHHLWDQLQDELKRPA